MPRFITLAVYGRRDHTTPTHVNTDAIRTIHEQVVRNPDGPNRTVTVVTLPESELHVEETVQQVLGLIENAS